MTIGRCGQPWTKTLVLQTKLPIAHEFDVNTVSVLTGVRTSLVASCKNNFVEPRAYLKAIFARLARQPDESSLPQLLPNSWLTANPTHHWQFATHRKANRQK